MKFDKVIMNPPFKGTLHLNILDYVITNSLSNKWHVVNLSPIAWLLHVVNYTKPNSDFFKVYNKDWVKNWKGLDFISQDDSIKLFEDAKFPILLGIYDVDSKEETDYIKNITLEKPEIKLVLRLKDIFIKDSLETHIDNDLKEGIRVLFRAIGGGAWTAMKPHTFDSFRDLNNVFYDGLDKDGKPWYTHWSMNQYSKTTDYLPLSIKFDSKEHAENFLKFYQLDWVKWYIMYIHNNMHIFPKYFPMPDVNVEWTNEKFEEYYNITDSEKQLFEKSYSFE